MIKCFSFFRIKCALVVVLSTIVGSFAMQDVPLERRLMTKPFSDLTRIAYNRGEYVLACAQDRHLDIQCEQLTPKQIRDLSSAAHRENMPLSYYLLEKRTDLPADLMLAFNITETQTNRKNNILCGACRAASCC